MNLVLIENNQPVMESRVAAELTGVRHADLLEKIDGYNRHLLNGKFRSVDFFIESTYTDGTGRTLKCYLLTRKGCDMVANKMTGEKGVLFTATYVMKFEEMEKQISRPQIPHTLPEALRLAADLAEKNEQLLLVSAQKDQIIHELQPKANYVDEILKSKSTVTVTQIAKDYGLSGTRLNEILHEEGVQYKLNGQWLLYSKHQDKGYTRSQTIPIFHKDGSQSVNMNTRWTQKGRLFIHELLTKRSIIPFMDRDLA